MFVIKLMEAFYSSLKKHKAKRELKILIKNRKEELSYNGILDKSAKKETCFIFGNGPSIADLDFSLFKDEDVFVVNQVSRYSDFSSLKVKYHVISDPIFFKDDEQHNPTIEQELLDKLLLVGKNNPECITFAASSKDNGVVKELNKYSKVITFPFYSHMEDYPNLTSTLSKPLPWFNNVVQFSIFIAICLGYKKIYLLGCEQSTIISILKTKMEQNVDSNIYGCHLPQVEQERMQKLFNSQSLTSYLSMFSMMYHDFDLLNDFSLKNGVSIVNCTNVTLLESFKKGNINEILKEE